MDFIIYGPLGFWAIEVKRAQDIFRNDVKSLIIFKNEFPEASCCLLYNGKSKREIDGILCLPVEDFLKNLHPEKIIL